MEDEGAHEAGHSLYLPEAKAPSLSLQNQSDIRPRKPLLARILKHKKKTTKDGYLEELSVK